MLLGGRQVLTGPDRRGDGQSFPVFGPAGTELFRHLRGEDKGQPDGRSAVSWQLQMCIRDRENYAIIGDHDEGTLKSKGDKAILRAIEVLESVREEGQLCTDM